MKSLYAFALTAVVFAAATSATMANTETKEAMRNDRVSANQGIAQYDINPFVDSKRAARHDRASDALIKSEKRSERKATDEKSTEKNNQMMLSSSVPAF